MVGSLPRPVGNERQPKTERSLYVAYMKTLPVPTDRPDFNSPNLAPIDNIGVNPYTHNVPTSWRTLHCPKRTVWCDVNRRHHALVFAPTHEYSYSSNKWVDKTKMNCGGEQVEFFVNQGKFVYYVGTYVVHSMRTVHQPGSSIASDSSSAIYRATGLNKEHSEKVAECFPDGAIKTECFGLQCVGFNRELYEGLRERFVRADGGDQKRKAGADDLRGSESAKSQRIA
ncbi:hypothetical protein B0H11DRAFT_1122505 [Mycena galericulata]|nr:hypothetical protein B0H11DRAFT_1122505 [Mycena galericulata]